jgi:hypothetical protein
MDNNLEELNKEKIKELYENIQLLHEVLKKEQEGIIEGFSLNPAEIVKSIIAKTKSIFSSIGNTIKKGLNSALSKLKSLFKSFGKLLKSGFKVITNVLKKVTKKFVQMGKGIGDIFKGIGQEFQGLGKGMRITFENIGQLMFWVGEFSFSYIRCGIQHLQNLHRCIFFYLIDMLGQLLYLPFRITLFVLYLMKFNCYPTEKVIWNQLYSWDSYIYQLSGVHIARYPKNIRDMCYNCKRLKIDALKNKVSQINYDLTKRVPKLLSIGVKTMKQGGNKFKGAFR